METKCYGGIPGMRISTIINGKGGVGKTTTSHALATGLDKSKYKSLTIDYDPQGNLSYAFGVDVNNTPTMYHVFNGDITIQEAIQHTRQGDIIAGNGFLGQLEAMFSGPAYLRSIRKLSEQLRQLQEEYTHIFIDNQPLIGGILTTQALACADDLVIPVSADTFTIQGLAKLHGALIDIREMINPQIKIDGLLLTRHNPRTIISGDLANNMRQWATAEQTRVYQSFIRESVVVKEAQASKKSLFEYAPQSNPAVDYQAFIMEYLNQEGK